MIHLIASDIDGTLLQGGQTRLDPALFDVIERLEQHGIRFGRTPPFAAVLQGDSMAVLKIRIPDDEMACLEVLAERKARPKHRSFYPL